MARAWVAICKGCGKRGIVQYVQAASNELEMIPPTQKFNAECPLCHFQNVFLASDLQEEHAYNSQSPPHS